MLNAEINRNPTIVSSDTTAVGSKRTRVDEERVTPSSTTKRQRIKRVVRWAEKPQIHPQELIDFNPDDIWYTVSFPLLLLHYVILLALLAFCYCFGSQKKIFAIHCII